MKSRVNKAVKFLRTAIVPIGFFVAISTVSAAGLVPCQNNCTFCDFFKLAQNIITFVTELSFALGVGFMVWGGIDMIFSGGDESKFKAGKDRVVTAVIGITIILCAWIIVGTVLQVLNGSASKIPWNTIKC